MDQITYFDDFYYERPDGQPVLITVDRLRDGRVHVSADKRQLTLHHFSRAIAAELGPTSRFMFTSTDTDWTATEM